MSVQLFNEIEKLKAAQKAFLDEVASVKSALEENRVLVERISKLEAKVEVLSALRKAIEDDYAAMSGIYVDRLDPTKVRMPETLRLLGYVLET